MTAKVSSAVKTEHDHEYHRLELIVAQRVAEAHKFVAHTGPLFTTNAEGLFTEYLAGIPEGNRQHYTCRCCQKFIEKYGGLAFITPNEGKPVSAIWAPSANVPEFFLDSVERLYDRVAKAKVTGVFLSEEKVWGVPQTGEWTHLHGVPAVRFSNPLKTAEQIAAEKGQDYIMLKRGLSEIPVEATEQAIRVLSAEVVDRSEKVLGIAQWLLALQKSLEGRKGTVRDNLVWLAVATAPPGWCHIRSTVISTLLDDILAGLPFETIKRKWNEKMHPLQYQRPTTLKEGTIKQANEVVEKLNAAGSLNRRFAKLEEVLPFAIWTPRTEEKEEPKKSEGGAFDHLSSAKRRVKEVALPPRLIAWDDFKAVLAEATAIEFYVPIGRASYYGLTTAADPNSQPILQWDGIAEVRNPFCWFFYHGGSMANRWGLSSGTYVPVKAVLLKPCHWQAPEKFSHQVPGVFFVLEGAKDIYHDNGGGLFPECLRAEYHSIRSAVEAHARRATIAGKDEGTANGIALESNPSQRMDTYEFRVKTRYGWTRYNLRY